MVILVLLMLAFPLTIASWFLVMHFREARQTVVAPEPPRVIDDSALRNSFESVAANAWSDVAAPLDAGSSDRIEALIEADDTAARQAQIAAEVTKTGGTAVIFPSDENETYRILATLPMDRAGKFLTDLTGSAPTLEAGGQSVLVEIRVSKPAEP